MDYVDLHLHSTFSLLDAYGTPKQIVDRSVELGREAVAITDHGMVSGFLKLEKSCVEKDIKPIYGCEFYTVKGAGIRDRERSHLTILAKNQIGYENLMKLVTESWRNGFYYKPRIDGKMLNRYREGLIILSGCYSGSVCKKFYKGEEDKAVEIVKVFRERFGEDYYLEIQPLALTYEYNKFIQSVSDVLKIPIVMTNDVHYVLRGQYRIQSILRAVQGISMEGKDPIKSQFILSEDEINKIVSRYGGIDWNSAMLRSMEICDKISVDIPRMSLMEYPEKSTDRIGMLREACKSSLKWMELKKDSIYSRRLDYELDVIDKKDFSSYFLLLGDLCKYMSKKGILHGPGRGSSAGSLVCFLLEITLVDPIKYDLLFERFLDINRDDYPDIDTDIESGKIEDVKSYVYDKFGENRVASIATFSEYKGKNIIDDLARVFKIPKSDSNLFKSRIIEYSDADARFSYTIEDTIKKYPEVQNIVKKHPEFKNAKLMEGQYRHFGKHAAGLVVCKEDISKTSAMYYRNGENLICWEHRDFARVNVLKIDLLKLKTLDVIKDIIGMVGMSIDDLYRLPLNDPKVFSGFKDFDMLGIFQFDGYSAYWVLSQVNIEKLDDLAHVNALGRPGPIFSRAAHRYIKSQHGEKDSCSKLLEKFVENTGGEIIYQEQVMAIVRELGGFDWSDASKLRKIMAKSMGIEGFNEYKDKYLEGCKKNGLDIDECEEIWDRMATFGSWAFNRSHAFAYAALGYWCMFFKVYYPMEFYYASLLHETDEEKQNKLLMRFVDYGKIFGANVNKSDLGWKLIGNDLYMGLINLKGVGEKTAMEIISNRSYSNVEDLMKKTSSRIVNSKIVKILKENRSFEDVEIKPKGVEIFSNLKDRTRIKDIGWQTGKKRMPVELVCFIRKRALYNQKQEDEIRGIYKDYADDNLDFMVVNLEDDTGAIKAKVNRKTFPQYKELLFDSSNNMEVFRVKGTQPFEQRTIWINEIERIEQ